MAKVSFDPIIKWFTGRIGGLVYRRSHNGKVSAYPTPDMSSVKWSQAQKDQRQRMSEASKYASAAVADPEGVHDLVGALPELGDVDARGAQARALRVELLDVAPRDKDLPSRGDLDESSHESVFSSSAYVQLNLLWFWRVRN